MSDGATLSASFGCADRVESVEWAFPVRIEQLALLLALPVPVLHLIAGAALCDGLGRARRGIVDIEPHMDQRPGHARQKRSVCSHDETGGDARASRSNPERLDAKRRTRCGLWPYTPEDFCSTYSRTFLRTGSGNCGWPSIRLITAAESPEFLCLL